MSRDQKLNAEYRLFKHLVENSFKKKFSLLLKGKNPLATEFPLGETVFSINCLKKKSVYKITKDFPLV